MVISMLIDLIDAATDAVTESDTAAAALTRVNNCTINVDPTSILCLFSSDIADVFGE